MCFLKSINSGIRILFIISMILSLEMLYPASADFENSLKKIKLPANFRIELYADNVPGARSLTLGEKGTIFAGTRGEGRVYALVDINGDYKSDKTYTIISRLNRPNGVAFKDGALYIAEVNRIIRLDNIEAKLDAPPQLIVINATLPSDQAHGWKYLQFGPDNMLYVPVGAPCNVCLPDDSYAALLRLKKDGTGLEIYARGIRNTVGFDWHPLTGELWFTDNGRDWLGDDLPPDELNYAPHKELHFGFPYFHGMNIRDPQYGKGKEPGNFNPPAIELAPHAAALGMKFYRGTQFPGTYLNQIFIAEHGSWNRSVPNGYRITLVRLKGNRAESYEVFAEGWLQGSKAWGRPVDLLILKDGSLLVSDDLAGAVYRISYNRENS